MDKLITDDIERGFALLLPISCLYKIPNASLAPLGCHKQSKIDERGQPIPKSRMTYDQSFPGPSGLSVNLTVQKNLLSPILYSYVMSRLLHYIVNTCFRHPSTKIFICKIDIDAAFRHGTLAGTTATDSLTIVDDLLLMALQMTFGGAPCPSLWGVISETLANIANSLLQNPHWDHHLLYDPISDTLDSPSSLLESIPFHPGKELAVSLPPNDRKVILIFTLTIQQGSRRIWLTTRLGSVELSHWQSAPLLAW
jgi:hypothetical protein